MTFLIRPPSGFGGVCPGLQPFSAVPNQLDHAVTPSSHTRVYFIISCPQWIVIIMIPDATLTGEAKFANIVFDISWNSPPQVLHE